MVPKIFYSFRCCIVLQARTAKELYDTSCRTRAIFDSRVMRGARAVFDARAMRGARVECANVFAH